MARRLGLVASALLGLSQLSHASPTPAAAPEATTTLASSSSSSAPSSASKTSSSAAATHTVDVGKATNAFTPDVVQAAVGDIIEFNFFPSNHSVIRSAYKYPCIPYEDTVPTAVGFFSGFQPVDAILPDPPTWTLKINDTNPIFYYCGAPGSCINYQMVGVINPNKSVSLAVQKQLAKDSSYMLEPGEDFPAEASASISSLAATATGDAVATASSGPATTQTPTAQTPAASTSSPSHGLSSGAIAGIAIGGAAVLVLAAALFYFIGRDKRKPAEEQARQSVAHFGGPGGAAPSMIQHDGVIYAPVAAADYKHGHGSLVLPPGYDQQKSPEMSIHQAGFSPLSSTPRSPSPAGSNSAETPIHSALAQDRAQRMSTFKPAVETSSNPSRSRIHEMFAPFPNQYAPEAHPPNQYAPDAHSQNQHAPDTHL